MFAIVSVIFYQVLRAHWIVIWILLCFATLIKKKLHNNMLTLFVVEALEQGKVLIFKLGRFWNRYIFSSPSVVGLDWVHLVPKLLTLTPGLVLKKWIVWVWGFWIWRPSVYVHITVCTPENWCGKYINFQAWKISLPSPLYQGNKYPLSH